MTWKEALAQCPEGVVPACHNSVNTVTISGPAAKVKQFVAELKEKQIFAREVNSSDVAFHSPSMMKVAPKLRETLGKVELLAHYCIDSKSKCISENSDNLPKPSYLYRVGGNQKC